MSYFPRKMFVSPIDRANLQMVITPSCSHTVTTQILNTGERNGNQPGSSPGEGQPARPMIPDTSACAYGLREGQAVCPSEVQAPKSPI